MGCDTWLIDFISRDDFYKHVKDTVETYSKSLNSYDLEKLNANIIDPIKLLLDKYVYDQSWEGIVEREVSLQRDKTNNNAIGYFHQCIFSYIDGCEVPDAGWDVIYRNDSGIDIGEGGTVSTVYVEMKNKHNTMNSSAASKLRQRMQEQIVQDDSCACFLVETIAKTSQNIRWAPGKDTQPHKLMRRVSIDQFYEIVTGDKCGFHKICTELPEAIAAAVDGAQETILPTDTAYSELTQGETDIVKSLYRLAFSSYSGFEESD